MSKKMGPKELETLRDTNPLVIKDKYEFDKYFYNPAAKLVHEYKEPVIYKQKGW
jgi:hypothetical protein